MQPSAIDLMTWIRTQRNSAGRIVRMRDGDLTITLELDTAGRLRRTHYARAGRVHTERCTHGYSTRTLSFQREDTTPMNWPAIIAPLLAPNFLVTIAVIACATVLLALRVIDPALWWTAVAGAGAIYTMRGGESDSVHIKNARAPQP